MSKEQGRQRGIDLLRARVAGLERDLEAQDCAGRIFRRVVEDNPAGIVAVMALHVSLEGRWLKLPSSFVRFLGYETDAGLLGRQFRDFTHPDDFDAGWSQVQRLVRGEIRSFEMEQRFLRKDGSVARGYVNCSIVSGGEGKPAHLLAYVLDTNAGKQAEEALRQSEQRYRALFESMQEGFAMGEIILDEAGHPADWRYLNVNPAFESMSGRKREELAGRRYREVFPDAPWQYWVSGLGEVALTGKPAHLGVYNAGRNRHYEAIAYSPQPGQFAAIFSDVTARKEAEQALKASEERYRTLFTRMSEAFALGEAIFDEHGAPQDIRFIEVNDAFWEQTGLGREILGRPVREVLPNLEAVWIETYGRVALTGEPVRFDDYNRDTRRHYSVFSYSPSPGKFAILFRDITEMKRAENALRERERQFRELADSMPQLVWATDPAGSVTYVNRRWKEQLGIEVEELLGDRWAEILHPEDREKSLSHWRRCAETGEHYEIEYRFRTAAGEYRWFLARGVPIRDEQDRITRWFGTCTDVDDRKRAEERLRQAQKLESVGLLAGGIAHDFNNLLTGIMGNASMVLDEIAPGPAERIREVISGAERAANLTRQLLAYSGKGQFVVRDLDISQAVQEMSDLAQFSIPKSVNFGVTVHKRLPLVRMDPSQVQQILMNLVINASEAIGEGNPGEIALAASMTEVREPFIDAVGEEIAPGRYVCIEVSDTGSGVSDEARAKIFDPFFTTKFAGRGLGLAAVAGIVRSRKGGITLESIPGRGATFRVLLPAVKEQAPEERPCGDGRATVLVVDDERSVREFLGAALRRRGYKVLAATDGKEALVAYEAAHGAVDAVVLDVAMPVMGANELLPRIKARKPGLKVLLTSGYGEAEAKRLCAAYPGAAFIQKPYTAQQIVKCVEELLASQSRGAAR
ncbi:MAG: PAS domain S-box protein [Bryobacteraceae bacterium]